MEQTSLIEDRWPEVLSQLPRTLDLDISAFEHRALRRRRNVPDAQSLLRLCLLYGPGGASLRGAAAWTTHAGMCALSDVAVLKRLRGSCDWLEHISGALMSARVGEVADERPLRLTDGTVISGPGGRNWRLHATFDPVVGRFNHLELTDTRGGEKLTRGAVTPGEIRIADRGYARLNCLRHIVEGSGDFIVRTGWRSVTLRNCDGSEFNLFSTISAVSADRPAAFEVSIVDHKGGENLPARLIVLCKPEDAAEQERKRMRRRASKSGKKMDDRTLVAAGYTLLLTSLPVADYDAERIAALYQLRWQVELAFKRLKSIIRIDRLPAKDPRLARSWLAGHLVIALIIENIAGEFPDSFP